MKPDDHQDIIKQMADRLREHAVPYQEGAWERFKEIEKKKPRRLVLWPYFSAAAAILIAIVWFLKPEQQLPLTNELVEQNIQKEDNGMKSIKGQEKSNIRENPIGNNVDVQNVDVQTFGRKQIARTALVSKAVVEKERLKDSGFENGLEPVALKQEEMAVYRSEEGMIDKNNAIEKVITEPSSLVSVSVRKEEPADLLAALLANEDKGIIDNKGIDKKWSIGLEISPNISSNKQLNMGGGIAFAYSVSPKVSFSSGISYLQLDADRPPNMPSQMSSSPSSSSDTNEDFTVGGFPIGRSHVKTLNRVEANLIGLDVPLAIDYHVNKNLFASFGVSVFTVLNEDRINQFKNQEVNVLYNGAENKTPEPVVQTFYSMEKASEKHYEGKGLSGFYNFSIGYSIPVSKRVGLSVEPFFKIPMNTFRDDDMNLSNGGIKISTKF
jgi:hypothetical protein